jgi:hypothetical protein
MCIWALGGRKRSTLCSFCFNLSKTALWNPGPRTDQDAVEKNKNCSPCQEMNPDYLAAQPRACCYADWTMQLFKSSKECLSHIFLKTRCYYTKQQQECLCNRIICYGLEPSDIQFQVFWVTVFTLRLTVVIQKQRSIVYLIVLWRTLKTRSEVSIYQW